MVIVHRVVLSDLNQAYRLIHAGAINEFPEERAGAVVLGEDLVAIVDVPGDHVGRAVDGPGDPPAEVIVGVGGHAGIVGVVDIGQAVLAVVIVVELAVEGEIAVVVVSETGGGAGVGPELSLGADSDGLAGCAVPTFP
jgi:hypothetical protein